MLIKDKAAIVGIGQTPFARSLPQTEETLAVTAIGAALKDAGIKPQEVDGLCSYSFETSSADEIARDLGMGDIGFFALTPAGGGGGCGTVGYAAMAIATGQASVVVAWRSRKRGGRAARPWARVAEHVTGAAQWLRPYGVVRPADEIAMMARRYMHEFGVGREALADIAIAVRSHALRNPAAVFHDRPLDRETYFAGRWISEPLSLNDCCLETDGAAAVVLVSAERARDLRHRPAIVHAFSQGISAGSQTMHPFYNDDPLRTQAWASGRGLWSRSDIKPQDIKVAQIYDAFTPEILLSLEGYGFCERGEAGNFVADGGIALGGRLPVNTSGGSLAEVYLHGYNLILEAVRQVRGTSTAQVEGAESGSFVSSSDVVPTNALVLHS
jgi:acetyl-CoA acetyltransferase